MKIRLRLLLGALLTLLVVFTGRLAVLQFAQGELYRTLSEENVLEPRHITPPRGRILARDGTVLADNRVAVDLMYWGGEVANWGRLSYMLGLSGPPRAPDPNNVDESRNGAVAAWSIPDALLPAVEELVAGQPNLSLRSRVERTYPTGLAAHVVGYTTEADPERFPGYQLGDLVGQMGIEAADQEALFGAPGIELAQVDNRHRTISTRELLAPQAGEDVVLTIDPQAQATAERVLGGALSYVNDYRKSKGLPEETTLRGGLIAMDPRTGEILALASAPSFDPNVFTERPSSPSEISALFNDPNFPLYNRAVSAFPPASTFKLISSSALLEGGFITPETRYECSGGFSFGGRVWHNWTELYRGNYTIKEAIADSCNTFYWRATAATPNLREGWGDFAKSLSGRALELGYGEPLGVGLNEEEAGRVPTDAWVRETFGHPWYPGFSLNMAIGQGDVLATPVQVASLAETIAMKGRQAQPHLVKKVGDTPAVTPVREVPGQFWDTIESAMRLMITDYGGRHTLAPNRFPIPVAGKTGTAQNPNGVDHAWFTGYGPVGDPNLVVTVFIQHGGGSTAVATPIARDFMAAYWGVDTQAEAPTP